MTRLAVVDLIPVLAAKVVVVDPEYPVQPLRVTVREWVTVPDIPWAALMRPVTEMDPVDPVLVTIAEMLMKKVQATLIRLFRPEQILAV
jgi:hypothetical protein